MATLTATLALVQQYLTIILGVLLVVGVAGNILNCSVFLRKRSRSNACSVFFVGASMANIAVLIYYIIPTIYSSYSSSLENSDLVYCKLRLYICNASLVISRTYLTLACVSCYAQSSRNARIRNLCQPKIILRIVLLVPIICCIILLHISMLTSIQNGKCLMWADAAALYHSIYICFVAAILPTSLMIIFSLLAYNNLRHMVHNVYPHPMSSQNPTTEKTRLQQRDRQLYKMLFVQIIVYMIFTIAYPIQTVYNAIILIFGGTKSPDISAIESFTLFLTSGFLLNFDSATSFFVLLTSKTFRRELRLIVAVVLSPCAVITH